MAKARFQFSLQSAFAFMSVGVVMLGLNLRPTVTYGEIFLSISLPPGESNLRDWMLIERGFPFRYQHFRRIVPSGLGASLVKQGWPRADHVPAVTHVHWLLANILCAVTVAAVIIWAMPGTRHAASDNHRTP
jgi:hypothetical protein